MSETHTPLRNIPSPPQRTSHGAPAPRKSRRTVGKLRRNPLCVSASSSICNSDDSGIERTLNLRPSSPFPSNSDSEQESNNSLDDFQFSSGRSTEDNFGKSGLQLSDSLDLIHHHSPDVLPMRMLHSTQHVAYEYPSMESKGDNRFHILSFEQVSRLTAILTELIPIHSRRTGFPTVWVRLQDLFAVLREKLHSVGIPVKGIKLNGGAASYIIAMESSPAYNDIDVLILVDLSSHSSTIQRVKSAVLDALMSFLHQAPQQNTLWSNAEGSQTSLSLDIPSELSPVKEFVDAEMVNARQADVTSQSDLAYYSESGCSPAPQSLPSDTPSPNDSYRFNSGSEPGHAGYAPVTHSPTFQPNPHNSDITLRESYIYKQFRKFSTHETDCWSLISLGMPSQSSKVVELKFVDRMKRQFEFTVDSFQIHIDSVLKFLEQNDADCLNENFFPTVVAESVAGSYADAENHLRNKLILTREPEMIRGGGLLKYCRLMVNGYQAPEGVDVGSLERYMSSRFFIDFQDVDSQRAKIEAFLSNHFGEHESELKILFLQTVHRVVSGSSICLMSFERYQTLQLICELIENLDAKSHTAAAAPVNLDWLADQHKLVIDRIFLGNQLFPTISRFPNQQPLCESPYANGVTYIRNEFENSNSNSQLPGSLITSFHSAVQSRSSSESLDRLPSGNLFTVDASSSVPVPS